MLLLAFGDYRRPADRPLQLVDDQHVYVCDVTARQRGAVEVGLGDGCHDDLAQKRAVVVPEVVVEILVVIGDLFLFGGIFCLNNIKNSKYVLNAMGYIFLSIFCYQLVITNLFLLKKFLCTNCF